ncbi:unnamed protein product [Blepharisma stoltei]|uniref:Arf-GAP domain-containing protein n=1 Tax=Blepharisma stoltei TaxID=1481888 RepID=A0AAU9KCS7_9CILI|nr:unnamed protein product [Blepharisma stoltei]
MQPPEVINQVFNNLRQDPENNYCFDCGAPSADHASTNHGVLICAQCAGMHIVLGPSITNVKSWTAEPWTIKQLKLMAAGGNSAFREFLTQYNITRETPIAFKYRTKAAAYYRGMLDVVSENEPYDVDFPSADIGIQLIDENNPAYPNLAPAGPQQYPVLPQQNLQYAQPNTGNQYAPLPDGNSQNINAPPEPQPTGWKAWAKSAYNKTVEAGNKAATALNSYAATNPTLQKINEQGTEAINKVSEEVKKLSQHPRAQYVANVAKTTANQLVEGATISYNYFNTNPTVQQVKQDTMKFLGEVGRETKNASSAAMNYIKNKRNQGQRSEPELQQPLLQNPNPSS